MENQTVNTNKTPGLVLLASFIIIVAGIILGASIIKPLLMAIFIGIICAQPINWLQKKNVPKGFAITLVLISTVILFVTFASIVGNSLYSFSIELPKYEENLNTMSKSFFQVLEDKGIHIKSENMSSELAPSKILNLTQEILGQIGAAMSNAFTIFFLVAFLLFDMEGAPIKIKAIYKGSHNSLSFLNVIGTKIRQYLSIKTALSLFTGLLIWVSLTIIGVDYAIIWALIAFLLNYIPNIGSIIAAIPAVLFSLVQLGFDGALWTALVFVVVNMIIGNVVEPKLMGKGLGLTTFVVFLSLLFWGFVLGTVGMFLSVPLTMAIKIMLMQNEQTKWLGILLGTKEEAQTMI